MENLLSLYEALPLMTQIFWGCAIVASIFMLVQLVLSLFGMGDFEFDADVPNADGLDASGGMDLFTIKNITNFFVGFGWAGVSLRDVIVSDALLITVAIACGAIFVIIFIFLFKQLMKLESNGAVGIQECVGRSANVYLRIPSARTGKGKVQISLNGSIREYDAMTDDATSIPTGAIVKVLELTGNACLLVTAQSSEK